MASLSQQLRLLSTLDAYESAQRAADLFPNCSVTLKDQQAKADKLFMDLTRIAFACGYEPGGYHRDMLVLDFIRKRAAVVQRVFPANVAEDKIGRA